MQEKKNSGETPSESFDGFEYLSEEVKAFLRYHGPQLLSSGFPMEPNLVEKLYRKLVANTYDAGNPPIV